MAIDPNLYVGFSQGRGALVKAIQLFTGGKVNHAFLCWEDEHLGWVVLGANENGVTLDTWENFTKTRTVPCILRPMDDQTPLWSGLVALRDHLNEKYDKLGLVGMSIVEIARAHNIDCGNPLAKVGHTFCSQFTVDVVRAAGYEVLDPAPSDTIDPQELMKAMVRMEGVFKQGAVPRC